VDARFASRRRQVDLKTLSKAIEYAVIPTLSQAHKLQK
jgi:hypothetical protein